MQDTTKWTSNRIETIPCFAPRWQTGEDLTMPCESATDTVHARRELENMGLITRSLWAVAYLCPSHAVEAKAAL